jgi:hypothetical protein
MTPTAAAASTVGKATVRGPVSGFLWAMVVTWVFVDKLHWLEADDDAVIYLIATFVVLVLRSLERRWPAFGWGLLAAGAPEGYRPSPGSGPVIEVEEVGPPPEGAPVPGFAPDPAWAPGTPWPAAPQPLVEGDPGDLLDGGH